MHKNRKSVTGEYCDVLKFFQYWLFIEFTEQQFLQQFLLQRFSAQFVIKQFVFQQFSIG